MAKKYILAQTTRVAGKRYAGGDEAALIEAASKEEIADLIAREILVEVPDLGTAVEEEGAAEVVQLQGEVETLRTQNDAGSRELKAAEERASSLITEQTRLKGDLKKAQDDTTKAKTDLAAAKTKAATLEKERDDLKKDLTVAQSDLKKAQAELETLKKPAP